MRYCLPLIAFLGLICGAGCRRENARGVQVDSKLAAFVPSATTVLGGIDVDRIKSSAFYQRHKNELNLPLLNAASERLGLDPRRDIAAALFAWQSDQPILVARGSFSAKDLQSRMISLGARKTRYRNQDLFGDRNEAVFFPKQDILMAGAVSALRASIDGDRRDGDHDRTSGPIKQRLENLPKTDQVWAVSTHGFPVDRIPMRSDLGSALSNLVRYVGAASVGVGVDEGAHFQAELTCLSVDGARQVRDALRGGIGMARLMTKDNDVDTLHLYDAIHVDQDQQTVHVHADLTPELSDKLLKYLPLVTGRADQLLSR